MADDPCANRTLSGEGAAAVPRWNTRRQFQRRVSAVHSPTWVPRQSGGTPPLVLESQYPELSPGKAHADFQNLVAAVSPTGSCPARSLSPGQGGRSDAWARGAGPCLPGKLQRRRSNYRRREFRVRPSSGNPCTWGRNSDVSCRATFDIQGKVYRRVCARELSGCSRLFQHRGFWV